MDDARHDPWADVARLPDSAPVRRLTPGEYPRPAQVARRLEQEGVDATSAAAVMNAILRRGWTFWLFGGGSPRPRFGAAILEPRFGAVWAMVPGDTPAEALGTVLAVCLDNRPWELEGDEAAPVGAE
jgi:hypothetical protein